MDGSVATRGGPSFRVSLPQKLVAGLAVALSMVLALGIVAHVAISRLVSNARWVDHTHVVIERVQGIVAAISEIESAYRGYVITGDSTYLASARMTPDSVRHSVIALRALVADNPAQQSRVDELAPLIDERFRVLDSAVATRRAGRPPSAAVIRAGRGRALTEKIRQRATAFEQVERRLLGERTVRAATTAADTDVLIIAGFAAALGVGILAITLVLREVRARDLSRMEALRARDAAEEANRAKSDFLARMSHELRTPLNSVIGFAGILLKNRGANLRAVDIGYLERIAANGRHLLGVINDILDLAKVESGRLDLAIVPTAIDALVRDVVSQMESQVKGRPLVLETEIPDRLMPGLADPGKLRQVLINLVGNAVKFTDEGTVRVIVRCDEITGVPTSIEVADTGVGIPVERQRAVFDAFEQGETGASRQYGGTGLGLAISRSLCELMGFRLTLRSEVGVGSTFTIEMDMTLPRRLSREAPIAELSATAGGKGLAETVLIIDDDEDSRVLLAQYVDEFGSTPVVADGGERGMRMIAELKPAVVLLDLLMPGLSGFQLLARLAEIPSLRETRVIVTSVVGEDSRRLLPPGTDVVQKPVNREALFRALGATLSGRRGRRSSRDSIATAAIADGA